MDTGIAKAKAMRAQVTRVIETRRKKHQGLGYARLQDHLGNLTFCHRARESQSLE